MEPCYEYLGCDKKDCIMHGRKDTTRCWEDHVEERAAYPACYLHYLS